MTSMFGRALAGSLALALTGCSPAGAETWRLCKGGEQIGPLASASALVLLKDGQLNVPRTSLNVGHISLQNAPRMFPSTHLGFSYDLRSADLKVLELTNLHLSFNAADAPRVCGPGQAIIHADGQEVYRGIYDTTRGMCAIAVSLDRQEGGPGVVRAADAIAAATTVAVRFVSDDGLTNVGGAFQGLAPEARERSVRLALDRALSRTGAPERCQDYKTSFLDAAAPSRWAPIPKRKPS